MARYLAVLVMILFAAPAMAQSGAVGTGEDGCYFGKCPGDSDYKAPEDRDFERDDNNDYDRQRYNAGPLMCRTHSGECPMVVSAQTGSICNCPGMAQGYMSIGVVQPQRSPATALPDIASICSTAFGSCQMAVQLGRYQSCFCPTFNGPVGGVSQ